MMYEFTLNQHSESSAMNRTFGPPPEGPGNTREEDEKECKYQKTGRRAVGYCLCTSHNPCRPDLMVAGLWLPTVGLHRTGPVDAQSWIRALSLSDELLASSG